MEEPPGDELGEQARRLRRAGFTINEIEDALGVRSSRRLTEWLRGVPPDPSVRRRKAKVDLQERACKLRADGWSYNAIAAELGVAKSSVSTWCAGVVLTDEQRVALALPSAEAGRKRAESARAARIRRTEIIQTAAAAEIGDLTDRELFLIGVALYWAEGTKQKPWSTSRGVALINSDPGVVLVFLAWLRLLGIPLEDVRFRVTIHENASAEQATAYWADLVEVDPATFQRPTIKRHNPATQRKNVGDTYVGCLVVKVRRSTDLNRRIAGWWSGIAQTFSR